MNIKQLRTCIILVTLSFSVASCNENDNKLEETVTTSIIAFIDATVIPMNSEVELAHHTVLVRGGVIEDVGPDGAVEIPGDALVIDSQGNYLMPGLSDMHIHPLCAIDDCYLGSKELEVYLAYGVTSVLSMQDTGGTAGNPVKEFLTDPIKAGLIPGPTVYVASYAGGPEDLQGIADSSQIVITEQEGIDHVLASKRQGYDFIKIYDGINEQAFKGIIDQAEEEDMAVIGHFPKLDPKDALSQGLDMVAHSGAYLWRYFNFNLDPSKIDDAATVSLENDIYVNTTLGLEKKKMDLACANELAFQQLLDIPEIKYTNSTEQNIWRTFLYAITDFPGCTPEIMALQYGFIQQYVKIFHDSGVKLVLGTDSPLVWGVPGFSSHEELQAIAELGLSPYETLSIATKNAGEFIEDSLEDAQPFGTIEIGMRADMLLVAENPLLDINNVKKIKGVMARGRWYDAQKLEQLLENVATAYSGI